MVYVYIYINIYIYIYIYIYNLKAVGIIRGVQEAGIYQGQGKVITPHSICRI